ncbi:alkaline phosphatase family protein [Halovenus rubra]|uniref:Alkaline phosphatase family protein n=2 Tax=Halovenus rubra TaxID=869890 RepID=A0ABD5X245_9EURY|nr:alkaline phosphatase family protein [Halovenus rubra]
MTVVVLGIDALDPDLVGREKYPNLTLNQFERIETIVSSAGDPSTHELWPTIITGKKPDEHGILLDDGVAWESSLLKTASRVSDYAIPDSLQTRLGAWLLNNTSQDAFRIPATYYEENGLSTVFDEAVAEVIGVPNYVTDPDSEDREHQLRRRMGDLFERDPEAKGGHTSSDVAEFYEMCIEMVMIRIARVRRAVRSQQNQLVFGYTSGLDLIGHVSHDRPEMQRQAYEEIDQFVGELLDDLTDKDVLILVSDHGLQDGLHTEEAMISSTDPDLLANISSVTGVRNVIESSLGHRSHQTGSRWSDNEQEDKTDNQVKSHLEDLGYM